MKHRVSSLLLLVALALPAHALPHTVESSDGMLTASFELTEAGPRIAVARGGTVIAVLQPALDFTQGGAFGDGLELADVKRDAVDQAVALHFTKASQARERYREAVFALRERNAPFRRVDIVVRAYDDGVAFRYRIPEQPAFSDFVITDERTRFRMAAAPVAYALPLPFGSAYEDYYLEGPLASLKKDAMYGVPLLLKYPHGLTVAITEASLVDYAGMYLAPVAGTTDTLQSRLAPDLEDPTVKVRGRTPFESPWRVLMIGDRPGALIESNLVQLLNPPSRIADVSWIKPGKVEFPWWNGYRQPDAPHGARVALNTDTLKRYIDFCADNGIPYHSIDGFNFDYAWYGGPVIEYAGADITKAGPEIDMPAVLAYGRKRGVGTRLWVHYKGMERQLDAALATYERWGIEGIMVDFVNRDDQAMVRWVNDITRKAAEHHLTINFHGIYKPTGIERTWPNLLSFEAVLGVEYDKWSATGSPPEHEMLLPFVRGLAGPFDVHSGSFSPVAPAQYKPRFIHPRTIGTLIRQVAAYVVYDNPLPMLADAPTAYTAHPEAFAFVRAVPTTWDETRVVHGEIGHSIAVARRSGRDWYVGTMNDRSPLDLRLPLAFLGEGRWRCDVLEDGADADRVPADYVQRHVTVGARDTLDLRLASAGGNAIHCMPE